MKRTKTPKKNRHPKPSSLWPMKRRRHAAGRAERNRKFVVAKA